MSDPSVEGSGRGSRRDPYTAAWSCAANAVLYIDDPGPGRLAAGSASDPRLVSRHEAWAEFYARYLLVELRAEPAALEQAMTTARDELAGGYPRLIRDQLRASRADREGWAWTWERLRPGELRAHRRVQRLALELAAAARAMITEAGADDDPHARARLLTATEHAVTDEALGGLLPAEDRAESAASLAQRLEAIDADQAAHGGADPGSAEGRQQ